MRELKLALGAPRRAGVAGYAGSSARQRAPGLFAPRKRGAGREQARAR